MSQPIVVSHFRWIHWSPDPQFPSLSRKTAFEYLQDHSPPFCNLLTVKLLKNTRKPFVFSLRDIQHTACHTIDMTRSAQTRSDALYQADRGGRPSIHDFVPQHNFQDSNWSSISSYKQFSITRRETLMVQGKHTPVQKFDRLMLVAKLLAKSGQEHNSHTG